jgi:hypothetical protein
MFVLIPRIGVHIDPEVLRYIFSNIQGEAGSKVTTEECEGEDDLWVNG